MPRLSYEISWHCSLYASYAGWATALFMQSRKFPAQAYQYQVIGINSSDILLPNELSKAVFDLWWSNFTDPEMRKGGLYPVERLYCNTLHYKDGIRRQFNQVKLKGYQGHPKPMVGEWQYYQIRHWSHVTGLSGDLLESALLNLSAAINNGQLKVDAEIAQQLREEMRGGYDWEVGVKSMPVTLAAFVQAFSQMPLTAKATAAQAYLRGSWA